MQDESTDTYKIISRDRATSEIANRMASHGKPLVIARLEKPGGMEWSEEVHRDNGGASIRLLRGYDVHDDVKLTWLDVLYGVVE